MLKWQGHERPQLSTKDSRNSDSSDDSSPIDNSQKIHIKSEISPGIDPLEQRLPTEAIPTDRQPSRHLLRRK